MAKKNLTIRIEDEMREQLQLIADREMRPLANQVLFFLANSMNQYLSENSLHYFPDEGMIMTVSEYKELLRKRETDNIPF
ncbi:hypothetical protein [Dethiosulfovibrio salsuginis]|uniref:Uncharacterized protein n=1 Tax=Dethiosulfovibrio salsuginis TaxID=561720 RepID=A0A1X7KHN1_9BACT|nr:hypothetical protein [Dethiosulfovibrio salsuginis]SMG40858.1 hypothetical protein SAMN06275492_12834 [Dethiosulfovibrio salsuginis]